MFNLSSILEVVIGIVFVYILLSLLVAQINTVVAYLLNIRAEQLQSGGGSWQYRFAVSVGDAVLATGRVAVIAQPG